MKPTFFRLAIIMVVILILGVSCSTDDRKDNDNGINYGVTNKDDGSLSKKDIVGSYTYSYNKSIKRELEIDFDSDFTGQAFETSYGSSSGNFLSAYKYVFEWSIEKGKVLLNGVYATVDYDGNIGTSISWSAEFEFKQGVLVPGRGFSEGYAETALKDQKSEDVKEYIDSEIKYDVDNSLFTVIVKSNLKDKWSGYTIRYGVRYYSTGSDSWFKTSSEETVTFSFIDAYIDVYVQSLKGLYAERNSLSSEEKNLRDGLIDEINNYIKSLKQDKVFTVVVSVGDDVFTIKSKYNILNSVLLSDWGSSNSGNNNNNGSSQTGTLNGHEWVDLGLSVKWATCNVGASKPEDYGDYYSWGETSTKSSYSWKNYCFRTSGTDYYNVIFSKYNTSSSYGTVDNKTELDESDDVAHFKWGGGWRMPTMLELYELKDYCTWTWTRQNGVRGYRVTSNKSGYTDRSIFLPAAGYRDGTSLSGAVSYGYYWSSSLDTYYPYNARCLYFNSDKDNPESGSGGRRFGKSVRPVCP